MTRRILFIDEERFVHKALKRSFRKMQDQWDMRFASTPQEAMAQLDAAPADVIVTETLFAGQDGIAFLRSIRDTHPESVRIILSGYADQDIVLRSVDLAHQYLAKPCEDDALKATIARAFLMKGLLENEPLKQAVSKIDALPSVPALYIALQDELASEDASISKIGDIIAKDIGLTAKILKLVNSAFFGLPQQITNPAKAASLLGVDLIKAIVLTHGTFEKFKHLNVPGFSLDDMWQHSMTSAACAKLIAQHAGLDRKTADAAFMSGLLHDIGKLLMAAHLPDQFALVHAHKQQHGGTMAEVEMAVIGTTHAAIGAYLLGLWGLPDPIIDAAAFHHDPSHKASTTITTTIIVHVADALSKAVPGPSGTLDGVDHVYLGEIGLLPHLEKWQTACSEYLDGATN